MNSSTTSTASKLAIVFGIGAALTATYSKGKIVYADSKSKLEVDRPGNDDKVNGVYDVTITSDTEITEVYRTPPAADAALAGAKTTATTGRSSPNYGFAGSERVAR